MSKIVIYFTIIVVFIAGLSIGMYYGLKNTNEPIAVEKKPIDSVQDIVIKNVQAEESVMKEDKIEAISNVERISPYAKMVIEKKYQKCGHTTIHVMEVPKELVNLTKEELQKKYSGWDIKSFSAHEFTLYRLINANCEDHFVLREEGGFVAVFNDMTEEVSNLVKKTNILVEDLREEDKHDLESGIEVYGKDAVESILQTL